MFCIDYAASHCLGFVVAVKKRFFTKPVVSDGLATANATCRIAKQPQALLPEDLAPTVEFAEQTIPEWKALFAEHAH